MNKFVKIVVGSLSFVPALIGVVSLVMVLITFTEVAAAGGTASPDQMTGMMDDMLVLQAISLVIILVLLVFYLGEECAHCVEQLVAIMDSIRGLDELYGKIYF